MPAPGRAHYWLGGKNHYPVDQAVGDQPWEMFGSERRCDA